MLARSLSVGKQLATMLEQRESERARCKGKPTTFSRQPPHGRDAANVDGELLNGAEWRKAKRVKARGGKRERESGRCWGWTEKESITREGAARNDGKAYPPTCYGRANLLL